MRAVPFEALSLYLGALLGSAGLTKLLNPGPTVKFLTELFPSIPIQGLPKQTLRLGWSEVVVGAFLISGVLAALVAWVNLILWCAFFAAIVLAIVRRSQVSCGCFGRSEEPVDAAKLFTSLVLAVAAAIYLKLVLNAENESMTILRLSFTALYLLWGTFLYLRIRRARAAYSRVRARAIAQIP